MGRMVIMKDPHKSVFLLDWQDMSEVKHLFSPIPNEQQHCLPGQTWVQYDTTNCTIDSFWYGSLIWANQTVSYNFCVMCCIVQLLVWTSSGTFKQKVMETNWRWAMGWVDAYVVTGWVLGVMCRLMKCLRCRHISFCNNFSTKDRH